MGEYLHDPDLIDNHYGNSITIKWKELGTEHGKK